MTDTLVVILGREVVGKVTRISGGRLRFDYDDAYRARAGATPLSLSMPTHIGTHPDHVITPWLWGLLPDNLSVLDRWAKRFQVSASSPFALLSTPVGEDCAGAFRFVAPDAVDRGVSGTGNVTWLQEHEVAQKLRDLREDSTSWLGASFTGQFSLAGAQAKTALLFREGRWGVPAGAIPTTHILKPPIPGLDDHDLNEHLCLTAAGLLGFVTAKSRIARFEDETAIVIERYDRVVGATGIRRVHQEDLCQALGLSPRLKYQNEGGPNPPGIVRFFRQIMGSQVANEAVRRFADALIWNWLIGGTDAHARNYALLLDGSEVRLAPMYDVASALPSDTPERDLRMAMKIGGRYDVSLRHNNWPRAARELGLAENELVSRVRQLAGAAPDAFATAANQQAVRELQRPLAGKLVDLVAKRARACLKLVGSAG